MSAILDESPVTESPIDREYLQCGWEHDAEITDILEGRSEPPQELNEALTLLRERFGCIFKKLPLELQHDPNSIFEAAVQSSGHELQYLPESARNSLDETFFLRLFERGVPVWATKYASKEVQTSAAIRYVIEQDEARVKEEKDRAARRESA